MRRTLVILLLLANAVVLYWNLPQGDGPASPPAVPTGPPQEIAMLPLPAPGAVAAAAPAVGPEKNPAPAVAAAPPDPVPTTPSTPSPAPAATLPAAVTEAGSGSGDPLCVQTGWMPVQRIDVLANDPTLRTDRRSGTWLRLSAGERPVWMVFAGPMDKKDILPLQQQLAGQGVKSQEVFTPWRFALPATARGGLNLGYFDSEAAAQAQQTRAVAAGAAQASVIAVAKPQTQRLRARLTDAARVQALIAASDPRAPWQACPAGVSASTALDDAAFGDGEGVRSEPLPRR
ncbi:hypothetical protein [Amphibiibacter pelophylacis]|uniref:Uncharacterized protein n=1 Tax=Amphibiibacter pelophylacis TaxID=1799477 RepID=A0ACC6P5S2_9BURK